MNKTRLALVVVLIVSMLSAVGVAFAATDLADINGKKISLEDFNKKYKENLKYFQFKAPTKQSILDDLIKRELGIQEARRLGLDKDPDILDRMNTVLYHALVEKKLGKDFEQINITDDEAKKFYSQNPEVRTSHVFVAVRGDASDEEVKKAREKIESIGEELSAGKMSFAEIAQRRSEGVAAPMGGDIDYQTKDKLDPTYYETAMKLRSPGKVSGIVRSQFGFHIIRLTAIRPWEEADKAQVKRQLFDQRRADLFEKYMTSLRKTAKVSVKQELLKD